MFVGTFSWSEFFYELFVLCCVELCDIPTHYKRWFDVADDNDLEVWNLSDTIPRISAFSCDLLLLVQLINSILRHEPLDHYASAMPDWPAEALCSRIARSSVRPSVRYKTCERDVLKRNEPMLMHIVTSVPWGNGMKRSSLGVRRSKVKVTQGRSEIWRPGGGIIVDYRGSSMFL